MVFRNYFFNCSEEYINQIDPSLFEEISCVLENLPHRSIQKEINIDLFKSLIKNNWNFDSLPGRLFDDNGLIEEVKKNNHRELCLNSVRSEVKWRCDFAKKLNNQLVQIEAQFGKVELMFKDFCGFEMAYSEGRLALGIEIVIFNPQRYFVHRRSSISGMAYFDIAKMVLPLIGFNAPIWLIGIE